MSFDLYFAIPSLINKSTNLICIVNALKSPYDMPDPQLKRFREPLLPRWQSSEGQHGAHLGPVGQRWAHVGPMNLAIGVVSRYVFTHCRCCMLMGCDPSTKIVILVLLPNRSQVGSYVIVWQVFYLLRAWLSNHRPNKLWGEITYPFPNFNGATVVVWE